MNNMQDMIQEKMRETITKPAISHVNIKSTRASQAEIEDRYKKAKILEELGISTSRFSGYDNEGHEDADELQAIILVNDDKEIPEDLRSRLIQKRQQKIKDGTKIKIK